MRTVQTHKRSFLVEHTLLPYVAKENDKRDLKDALQALIDIEHGNSLLPKAMQTRHKKWFHARFAEVIETLHRNQIISENVKNDFKAVLSGSNHSDGYYHLSLLISKAVPKK